jgi:hypothetical protein
LEGKIGNFFVDFHGDYPRTIDGGRSGHQI